MEPDVKVPAADALETAKALAREAIQRRAAREPSPVRRRPYSSSMRTPPDIIAALVGVLEAKDISTAAHTWRVVLYTRALAEAFGLDHASVDRLSFAAALHDVGKIDIPESILLKPGPLTQDEFRVMQGHTTLGHERLLRLGEDDDLALTLVRHHHERWDGKGYPDGLSGEGIPRVARFFAVVDSFDAMTSVRPYRAQIGPEAARRAVVELEAGMGSRYDADAVKAFADLYRTGSLSWILEYFNDSRPMPRYDQLADLKRIESRRA